MEIATFRGGGRLIEHTFVETLLDSRFTLCTRANAMRTHASSRMQMIARIRQEARRDDLSRRVQKSWVKKESRASQLLVVVLESMRSDMYDIEKLHTRLLGVGDPVPALDVNQAQLLLDHGLMDISYVSDVAAAVQHFLRSGIQVKQANQLMELATIRLRDPDGGAIYALLALTDASTEVLTSYMNLLLLMHPPSIERVVQLVNEGLLGSQSLYVEANAWMGQRSLEAAVLDDVMSVEVRASPALLHHMKCAMAEGATLYAASLTASVIIYATREYGLIGDVHQQLEDGLAMILGVRRVVYPTPDVALAQQLGQRQEVDDGAREARYRGEYENWTPKKMVNALFACVIGTEPPRQSTTIRGLMDSTSPMRKVLSARMYDAAWRSFNTGEPCTAPESVMLSEPWCRSIDRLVKLVGIYKQAFVHALPVNTL
jgi:hypothetical protein